MSDSNASGRAGRALESWVQVLLSTMLCSMALLMVSCWLCCFPCTCVQVIAVNQDDLGVAGDIIWKVSFEGWKSLGQQHRDIELVSMQQQQHCMSHQYDQEGS